MTDSGFGGLRIIRFSLVGTFPLTGRSLNRLKCPCRAFALGRRKEQGLRVTPCRKGRLKPI